MVQSWCSLQSRATVLWRSATLLILREDTIRSLDTLIQFIFGPSSHHPCTTTRSIVFLVRSCIWLWWTQTTSADKDYRLVMSEEHWPPCPLSLFLSSLLSLPLPLVLHLSLSRARLFACRSFLRVLSLTFRLRAGRSVCCCWTCCSCHSFFMQNYR